MLIHDTAGAWLLPSPSHGASASQELPTIKVKTAASCSFKTLLVRGPYPHLQVAGVQALLHLQPSEATGLPRGSHSPRNAPLPKPAVGFAVGILAPGLSGVNPALNVTTGPPAQRV